jgi:hypothetical protein
MPGESARINGRKGGRPKGSKSKGTLDKMAAREYVRQRVTAALDELISAQIANANGLKYLVARAKNGKFERIGASELAGVEDGAVVEVWEKDPSVQAFSDLLNRALDKPKEQEQAIDLKAELLIKWQ